MLRLLLQQPLPRRISPFISTSFHQTTPSTNSVDTQEISKFQRQASKWWNLDGPAGPLHVLNPIRLAYIRALIEKEILFHRRYENTRDIGENGKNVREADDGGPLAGVRIVDVGCGGGIVAEPLARLGGTVLGVDMAPEAISVAKAHMESDLRLRNTGRLEYETSAIEDVVGRKERFDVVLALEIIEHVSNPMEFLKNCGQLAGEGGVLVVSTLNRTLSSYLLGIVGAERVLRWLPRGTHDWKKFPRPEEVRGILDTHTGLETIDVVGVQYRPLSRRFTLSENLDVNYMLAARKPR